MTPLNTIRDFAPDNLPQAEAAGGSPSIDNKSYLSVLKSLAENNEWLSDQRLVERVFSRLEAIEPQTSEVAEKVADVYRKINYRLERPVTLNTVQVKISQDSTVPIPRKLLMAAGDQFSELLRAREEAVVDLSKEARSEILQHFVSYLSTGQTDFITDQNAMELLLLAKRYGVKDLSMKCVEQLLDPESRAEEGANERPISVAERELWDLLKEAKNNGITISRSNTGIVYIKMKDSRETKPWELLKQLHLFAPVKHLQLTDEKDLNKLLSFVAFNPDLVSLDLGNAENVVDVYLNILATNLTHLDSLCLKNAEITTIPKTISDRLKALDCSNCLLKNLSVPEAKTINCSFCDELITLDAPSAVMLDCSGCRSLRTLDAPLAVKIDCSFCVKLTTLSALSAATLKCDSCKALTTLDLPLAVTLDCGSCNNLETLNTPKAESLNCNDCASLITLNAPSVTTLSCQACHRLTTLNAPVAKTLNCRYCPALKTLKVPVVTTLNCRGCYSLTTLNAPLASTLDCSGCTRLQTLHVLDAVFSELKLEQFPHLKFTVRQQQLLAERQELLNYLASYEVDPASFALGGQIKVPEVPKLQLDCLWSPENHSVLLNEIKTSFNNSIDAVDCVNDKALYNGDEAHIKIGGKLYTKEQLKLGLEKMFTMLQSNEVEENAKKRMTALLFDLSNGLQEEDDPLKVNGSLIRLAVAGLEGDAERIEGTLQLFYRVAQLYNYLDSINFTDKTQGGYIDPASIKDDGNEKRSVDEMQKSLVHLLESVKSHKGYVGTPPETEPEQLRQYYQNLEQYLQLIAIHLEKLGDPEERAHHMIDLGIASLHCGERWIADAEQIYELSSSEPSGFLTMIDRIHAQDAQFRTGIIEELSKQFGVINVHRYDQYKRLVGREFGIRGSGAVEGLQDQFNDPLLTRALAREQFNEKYTLPLLISSHKEFLNSLYSNLKTRDLLIDFLKTSLPEEWVQEHFGPLLQKIQELEDNKTPREAIRQMLMKEGYYIRPDWSVAACVDAHIEQLEQNLRDMRITKEYLSKEKGERKELKANLRKNIEELTVFKTKLQQLPLEEQKNLLREKKIDLGREDNPNFAHEMRIAFIPNDYVESLLEKDPDGNSLPKLTSLATAKILAFIGKIHQKKPR